MGKNTPIEWCDHSWNPWIGCTKVSQGCKHCYAEALAGRFGKAEWGPAAQRVRTSAANWRKPLAWDKAARLAGTRARVFCASLADVFEERPEEDRDDLHSWRIELWELILGTPHLDWLLLTKRPENVRRMVPAYWHDKDKWPGNLWLGTSVEDQPAADWRIPELLRVPAPVHFLSCEPLLGPVDLTAIRCGDYVLNVLTGGWRGYGGMVTKLRGLVDWVIVGCESGPQARPMDAAWARSLRDQCGAAGTAFFMKQMIAGGKKLGFEEFPPDLQVREYPLAALPAAHVEGVR